MRAWGRKIKSWRTLRLGMLAALGVAGCAHYPLNEPLAKESAKRSYRFENLTRDDNTDDLLVLLTFSGGGTRAAALAYGVLEELAQTPIVWEDQPKRMLDEVDIISAVSGGSFTASYYCLFGDRLFEDFPEKFLQENITGRLATGVALPKNWFRLISGTFNNNDLAAEYYDRLLYEGATFKTLARRGSKPFLIINATDLSLGTPFSFTQEQFDLICSDLSTYPVSRAVAASSAFPGLLTPITVKNYSHLCQGNLARPEIQPPHNINQARRGRNHRTEIESYLNETNRSYIHLIDGGVSDNLGLRGPLNAIQGHGLLAHAFQNLRLNGRLKLVLIVVDAQVAPDRGWDKRESPPGPLESLLPTFMVPIRNNTIETIDNFCSSVQDWVEQLRNQPGGRAQAADFSFSLVQVGFNQLADPEERNHFETMPTNFNLAPQQVEELRLVARKLLRDSLNFRLLLRELQPAEAQPVSDP